MSWSRIVVAAAMAAVVSGCASVPSYYSERVGSGRVAAVPTVADEPPPAARRRARARPALPPTPAVAQAPAPEPENTGASGAALPAPSAEDQRIAQRERAINRSINSICRGC